MRIVHIGNTRPDSVFIPRWAEHSARQGHEVHVISPFGAKLDGVKVYVVPRLLLGVPYGDRVLGVMVRGILDKIKPDVVHAHYTTSYAYIAALANYHPLLVQAWGSDIWVGSEMGEKWKKRTKLALRRADRVLMTSDALRDYIHQNYNHGKLMVIPPIGIDLKVFTMDGRIEGRPFTVFSPRGSSPHYRQDVIVEAVMGLRQSGYDIHLITSPSGESKEKMAELYQMSDCVVSIPHSDQFASTLQEAMACGCVPIVANLPAYNKYLVNEWNARFVDSTEAGIVKMIIWEIVWCIANREECDKYRIRNREIAEREFDWDRCMRGLEEIYEEVSGIV